MTDVRDRARRPDGVFDGSILALRPGGAWPIAPANADALSDPDPLDVAESLYAMLPTGPARQSPDGTAIDPASRLASFWRALAYPLATLYRLIFGVSQESTAVTQSWSLAEWEHEYGLPDPCVMLDRGDDSEFLTVQTRLQWLIRKIRHEPVITPADFVRLAGLLNYAITIEEPHPYICGASQCGDASTQVSGGQKVEFYWIVRAASPGVEEFHAGDAVCGDTPLGRVKRLQSLECLFRTIAPAWTFPVFYYSEA